jgi:hypothetical protein
MSKMGLHDPFGHLQHKLWQKERPGIKLAIWLPTTKSRESTRLSCVQVACDTPLESFRQELQLCCRPRLDRRSERKVIAPQSYESSNLAVSELPFGSPETKSHLDIAPVKSCRVYYMGEGGGFLWVRAVVSLMSPRSPVACPNTKGAPS